MTDEADQGDLKLDRSGWGPGPWDDEPEDRIEWRYRDMPCLMVRNNGGAWCGYAAVPPGHPAHGMDMSDVPVDVHGGCTFTSACSGHVCHVPREGEPDDVWWIGFDTNHAGDYAPRDRAVTDYFAAMFGPDHPFADLGRYMLFPQAGYKAVPYVRAEVERLADQLIAMGGTDARG